VEIVGTWSDTEAAFGKLLGQLLHAEDRVAVALYLGLSSPEARRAALESAAKFALASDAEAADLFDLVTRATRSVRGRRNDLAHGLWGVSPELPDALLWSDQRAELLRDGKVRDYFKEASSGQSSRRSLMDVLDEDVQVYRLADLGADLADARDAYNAVYYLRLHLGGQTQLKDSIQNLPLIRRALQSKPAKDAK
jgi:hypothetical protein